MTEYRLMVAGTLMAPAKVQTLCDLIGADGATIVPAKGLWHGEVEDSASVTILTDSPIEPLRLRQLVAAWGAGSGESAVLLTTAEVDSWLVYTRQGLVA